MHCEFGGVKNGAFRRNRFVPMDDGFQGAYEQFVDEYGGSDVYYSVLNFDNLDIEQANLYGPIYIDFDFSISTEADYQNVKLDVLLAVAWLKENLQVPEEQIQLYFSGSKGFHLTIQPVVFNLEAHPNLNEKYKRLTDCISLNTPYHTMDRRIYDRRRLFRVPNSINSKTGLFKVPLSLQELRSHNFASLQAHAAEQRDTAWPEPALSEDMAAAWRRFLQWTDNKPVVVAREKKVLCAGEVRPLLPCVETALEQGVGEGGRNNMAVALASSLCQAGYSRPIALDTLLEWNDSNEPPLSEREIRTTLGSAFTMGSAERGYGCRFFKDAGLCRDGCRVATNERM